MRWPLIAASAIGILLISFAVSSGHVLNYPQLKAIARVSYTGLNAAACIYLMEFYLPLTLCMLLLWCVGMSSIYRGVIHNPAITSLVPCNNIFKLLVTAMVFWLKLASHPASHNLPMDMRKTCDIPGKMWASLASSGNADKTSRHPLLDCFIWPFGHFTLISDVGCSDMSCGESACKKFPDAPVSDMAICY